MFRLNDHHSMKELSNIGPKSPYIEILDNRVCMYCEFSKNDILLMQQLKVGVASSTKSVQGIPAFHDFTIRDPRYFMIPF